MTTRPLPLFPTSLVGSYAQPEWLIDRARLAGRFPPRVRARELWRPAPEHLAAGPGRRDRAGHPRAGGGRAGHRHRRRDPPGELLEPLRDRPGGRRRRQPGRGAGPQRAPQPGAAGGRPGAPAAAGRGGRPALPAGAHRPRREDDRAGAVHDVPAGAGRPLRRPRGAGHGLRRGGQRRGARPVRGRRRHRPAGRAVHAGPPGAGPAVRAEGAQPGPGGRTGTTAVHICFGYAAIIHDRPSGYSFLPELADCSCDQVSIETAQSHLDPCGAQAPDRQDDHPRRHRPVRPRRRERARRSPTGCAGRCPSSSRSGSWSPPTAA